MSKIKQHIHTTKTGSFVGEFGDAFIQDTDLEGGHVAPAIDQLVDVIRSKAFQESVAKAFSSEELKRIDQNIVTILSDGAAFDRDHIHKVGPMKRNRTTLNAEGLEKLIQTFVKKCHNLKKGERLFVAGGWANRNGGHAVNHVVERTTEDTFAFVTCNTGEGVEYHPSLSATFYPKEKRRCAIRVADIPAKRFLDPAVWYIFFRQRVVCDDENGPTGLYDVLLPHLAGEILHFAVKKNEDKCGHWETIQRAGTCYMRSILCAFRYLMKAEGFTQDQQKVYFYHIRKGYLAAVENDLKRVDLLRLEAADKKLIDLAVSQTGLAATKLWRRGAITKQDLEDLKSQVDSISQLCSSKVSEIDETKKATISIPSSACLLGFNNFDLLNETRDTEIFAGGPTEAVPQMFVDLLTPKTRSQDMKSLLKALEITHDQLERLRAKTSIAAASVSLHQICSAVEHLILSLDLDKISWTTVLDSYENRRKCTGLLFGVATHYVSASMSLPCDTAVFARRSLTMTALMALYDSIVRVTISSSSSTSSKEEDNPADGSHVLTDLLNNGVMRTPEGVSLGNKKPDDKTPTTAVSTPSSKGFGIELRSFDGKTLQDLTSKMLLLSPDLCRLRMNVLNYFNQHPCAGSAALFGLKLTPPGLIAQKDSPTHVFVDTLREGLNVSDKNMPDGSPRPPYMRMAKPGSMMSSLEQCVHWFASSTFGNMCQEFVHLRDMNVLYRLMLTPPNALRNANKTLPELWFLSHATPKWTVDYADPDGKFATVSLCIADHKTGNKMFHDGGSQLALDASNARFSSPGSAETYIKPSTNKQFTTEDDVLLVSDDDLPTFSGTVSPEDAERLISFLTTPSLSIPLVLSYFSSGSRLGQLINSDLQQLLESVLFEPGVFVSESMNVVSAPVLTNRVKRLGTPMGRLANELKHNPESTLRPLIELVRGAINLTGKGGISSPFASLLLYVVRVAGRVQAFCPAVCNNDSLRELREDVLSKQVRRILTVWLRNAHERDAIADSLKIHAHLALLPLTSADKFLSSASFVVLWHSKPEIAQQHESKGDVTTESEEDQLAAMANTIVGGGQSKKTKSIKMTSFTTPVHEVFQHLHFRREQILEWMEKMNNQDLDRTLQGIVNVALQESTIEEEESRKTSSSFYGWQAVSTKPMMCRRVVESEHNYPPSTDQYVLVEFPGAELVSVFFDKRTSTEKDCDYVTFFKDETYTTHWGPQKRLSGGSGSEWPGANGRPPLTIPASRFIVHFHSDATTQDWGFRLTACAPVTASRVQTLREELLTRGNKTEYTFTKLQQSLVESDNVIDDAIKWLKTHNKDKNEIETKEATNSIRGLYHNPVGSLQMNIQTGEVYMRKRMLMPIPTDIASHSIFKDLFGDNAGSLPYCAFKSNDVNRRWIEVLTSNKDGMIYSIMAWTPLQPGGKGVSAIARRGASVLPKMDEKDLGAFNLPHVPANSEDGLVSYCGKIFERYTFKKSNDDKEKLTKFEKLFIDVFETKEITKMADLVILKQIENENRFLMYVPPQGDVEENQGHPGAWFEIVPIPDNGLEVFALVDSGRKMQRCLVASTHSARALSTFASSNREMKDLPPPHLRNFGGNIFGGHIDEDGKMIPRPGAGALIKMKIGSITVCRTRGSIRFPVVPKRFGLEEAETEEYISKECLTGLLPDILLESYQFWRTGPRTIRGYSRTAGNSDDAVLVLWPSQTSGDAVVIRRKESKTMTLHSLRSPELNSLFKVFSRIESASHILVWSATTSATFGDECGVSIVELPRLQTQFRCNGQRLESLDFDGLYVMLQEDDDLKMLARGVPHFLPLRNALGDRFLMVPNFGLARPKVRSCPFSTLLAVDRTESWSNSVRTRYYVYPVHVSGAFLSTPSLSSALYMVLLRLLAREYIFASRLLTSCHTDQPLTNEENYILSLVAETFDDSHPNAHAVRLQLTIVCLESGAKQVPWADQLKGRKGGQDEDPVAKDMESYLNKYSHVSIECRLSRHAEEILMRGYFSSKLIGPDGRLDPSRIQQMPSWFQGRIAYLDLLKKREALDSSDRPDLDVTMNATSPCEKLGGSTGIFGLAQQYVGKAMVRLKKFGLNYAFHYKRPHEKGGEIKGAQAIQLLEMLRGEGTGKSPMMIGATNRTGFALLYEMLTGQVRLSVGDHPLGSSTSEDDKKKGDEEKIEEEEVTKQDDTKKETKIDPILLDMCEQLEPLMPQFERKDLILLLKKFGTVEAVVNIFLQGENVVEEILKTLRDPPTNEKKKEKNEDPVALQKSTSPYAHDARRLQGLFPQYTVEEIEALLEINSGNVQKTGNDLASLPLFSVRGMARKRIKEREEQSKAIGNSNQAEGPRAATSPSWTTARLMLQVMILNSLKRNRGRIPESDILILPILITFIVAKDHKWKEQSMFPQFPYISNASGLSTDGLKTQQNPSLSAFVKMTVDAANVITSSSQWKPVSELINTKLGAQGKLVLARGYDSGHFRGMSDCDCSRRIFSCTSSKDSDDHDAFADRPLVKLSNHVMTEDAEQPLPPSLRPAQSSSRHNVEVQLSRLPFDIRNHPACQSQAAKRVLKRLEKDLEYAAKQDQTKSSSPQLRYLNHVHAAKLLESGSSVQCSSDISTLLQKALVELENLRSSLTQLQSTDRDDLKQEIENALSLASSASDAKNVMERSEAKKKKEEEDEKEKKKEGEDGEAKIKDSVDASGGSHELAAPEGCDVKEFELLPVAERRSIKKLLQDARNGKTGEDLNSKGAKSVTKVLTKDDILKYSGGSFAFEFERLGGQKMKMSWEILVSSVLSSKQYEDLKRLNPFLTMEQTRNITSCVATALLRTVRIAQTGRALVLTGRLTNLIESFLRRLILSTEPKATEDMVRSAWQFAGRRNLDTALRRLRKMLSEQKTLRHEVGRDLADVALGMSDWDLAKAKFNIEKRGKNLVELASRKCFVNGSALPYVVASSDDETLPKPGTQLSRTKSKLIEQRRGLDRAALKAMAHMLKYAADALANELFCQRQYMSKSFWKRVMEKRREETKEDEEEKKEEEITSTLYDPRFLVFEYSSGFVLRKRQCELVSDFVASAKYGKRSCVHQMIMGAGKTRVIGPMLALILADGTSLVTQVCPSALLEMTRGVMRETFSRVLSKRIYTLKFDRQCDAAESPGPALNLFMKLQLAAKQRAVVCTTPESVKSLMLKYIDHLQILESANPSVRLPASSVSNQVRQKIIPDAISLSRRSVVADALNRILGLWSAKAKGVALIDEVDLVLHPLRSELNFPIGKKKALSMSPRRWEMPVHLLDGVLRSSSEISKVLQRGIKSCSVRLVGKNQYVLLQKEFYKSDLKVPCSKWLMRWLLSSENEIAKDSAKAEARVRRAAGDAKVDSGEVVKEQILQYIMSKENSTTRDAISECFSKDSIRTLNLARQWINTYLPHVLGKVERVSYGLLHERDLKRWEKLSSSEDDGDNADGKKDDDDIKKKESSDVSQSSRWSLAVPFIGKDVPSRAAEFACPEVLIGLSVLAFSYEGMRSRDFRYLVTNLKERMRHETGPVPERPSRVLFDSWKQNCTEEVLPLELLQVDDPPRFLTAFKSLCGNSEMISYFLVKLVFPRVLRRSEEKLSASGVDLGGEAIFGTRLGFSGTPSDLLPPSLAPCHYEFGSEAKMIRVLSTPEYVKTTCYDDTISVKKLLDNVANHEDKFAALIDTGALITGMSNEEVARYLLKVGLKHLDACVFLDASDQKMVVTREENATPLPLESSGIRRERRFTFYDQVHTTGIDVKQPLDAVAAVTIGKDMTLRDYSQGCWRMRGIGVGQTIHVFLIKEVYNLVRKVSDTKIVRNDLVAWLLTNSLASEDLQSAQLQRQLLSTVWRDTAFQRVRLSRAPQEQLPYKKNPNDPMLRTRFHKDMSREEVEKVVGNLPEMYEEPQNKNNPGDEKAKMLIEKNKLYISTYFNILSIMNQRVPQVMKLFRQLAPSYVEMATQGMDVDGVKAHLKQSPLSQIIPPHVLDQMFKVADQMLQQQKSKIEEAFNKRNEMKRKAEEQEAKEKAAKLLGETKSTDDGDDAAPASTNKDKETKKKEIAKWKWEDGKKWNDYTEEDNKQLEDAYQQDKEVYKLTNKWGEYLVYLRKHERRQKKISSGFQRRVRRFPSREESAVIRNVLLARWRHLKKSLTKSSKKEIALELHFIEEFLQYILKNVLEHSFKTRKGHEKEIKEIEDALKEIGSGNPDGGEEEKVDESSDTKRILIQSIRLFRERLEQNISDKVEVQRSYRDILRDLAESHRDVLSVEDWKRVEEMLSKIDEGSQDHEFNDMEIVQEQEKEVFLKKAVTPARRRGDGNLRPGQHQWSIDKLFTSQGRKDLFKSGNFYPVRSFRIGGRKDDVTLPFPFELVISEYHSEMLRATSEPRRMKNAVVLMRWIAPEIAIEVQEQETAKEERVVIANAEEKMSQLAVMMPEFEEKDLNVLLRHFDGDLEKVMGAYMTEGEDGMRDILDSSSDMVETEDSTDTETKTRTTSTTITSLRQSLDSRKEFCVILSLLEAEAVRRAHQQQSVNVKDWKRVELFTLDGLRLTSVTRAIAALKPPTLTRATTEQVLRLDTNAFTNAATCAKFFNSNLWYDTEETIRLLQSFSDSPESKRRQYFESMLDCRRRDSKNWKFCTVARVFEHSNEKELMRIREIVIRVQRAIYKKSWTLRDLFDRVDLNKDGSIGPIELANALQDLGIVKSMSTSDANVIMRYADRNSDGSMSFTEFLSQFSMGEEEKKSEDTDDSLVLVKKKSHESSLQKRLRLIEKRWKDRESNNDSSSLARRHPLQLSSSDTSLETLGNLFICSGSAIVENDLSVSSTEGGTRPTIAVRGIALDRETPGRWYFECTILSAGRACIGWADSQFAPNSRKSVGVGDETHSWGFDGFTKTKRWGSKDTSFGFVWSSGDVVGCLLEIDSSGFKISFSLNGEWKDGMGTAFNLTSRPASFRLTPVISFERGFQGRLNLGRSSFRYPPIGSTSVQYFAQRTLIERVVASAGTAYGKLRTTTGDAGMKIDDCLVEVAGGFPSCMLAGVVLTRGRWYFETLIHTPGHAVQIGFGDVQFVGTSRGGQGIGDDKSSWAFDGARVNKWHIEPRIWGAKWQSGDVLGVACDLESRTLKFSLNGNFSSPFGTAFENIEFVGGLTPGITANPPFKTTVNWGENGFKHKPPPGYRAVFDWIEKYRPSKAPVLRRALSESSHTSELENIRIMRASSGVYQIAVDRGMEWRISNNKAGRINILSTHKASGYTCAVLHCVRNEEKVVVVIRASGTMRSGPLQDPAKSKLNGVSCKSAVVRRSTSHDTFLEAALLFEFTKKSENKELEFEFGDSGYSKVKLPVRIETSSNINSMLSENVPYCLVRPTRDEVYPSAISDIVLGGNGKYYYEVVITVPARGGPLCVGWGDIEFFGDWSRDIGLGDDSHSYGLYIDEKREVTSRGWKLVNNKKQQDEEKKGKATWQWLSNQHGWKSYSELEIQTMEDAFQKNSPSCKITNQWGQYTIHLKETNRVQVKDNSGFKRPVRRYVGSQPPITVRSGTVIGCQVDLDLKQCTWVVDGKFVFKTAQGLKFSGGCVRPAVSVRGADAPPRGGDGRRAPLSSRHNLLDLNFGRKTFRLRPSAAGIRSVWEAREARPRRFSNVVEDDLSSSKTTTSSSSKISDEEDNTTRRVLQRYFQNHQDKVDAVASGLGVNGLDGILNELLS